MSSRIIIYTGFVIMMIAGSLALLITPGPSAKFKDVELSEDHKSLSAGFADADSTFTFTVEDWREYLEPQWEELYPEPVKIGDVEQPPERFDFIGNASLSPDQKQIFFSVTAYAMATTVSLVGVIDAETLRPHMMRDYSMGSIDGFGWSSDGSKIAYSLGSARAGGDYLRLDDLEKFEKITSFSQDEIIEALKEHDPEYHPGSDHPNRLLLKPRFREKEWVSDHQLEFTTNKYDRNDEEQVRWQYDIREGKLKVLD